MGRSGAALVAVMTVLCTACSTSTPTPPAPDAPSATLPVATAKKAAPPPFTPPASPAIVVRACPFLGTTELQRILETSEDIIMTEQPPDPAFPPGTQFQCRYEGKYVSPWLLDLWISTAALADGKRDCTGPVTVLPGVGDGAFFCDMAGDAELVATGKRSHGQDRIAVIHLRKHRADVYTTLAETLAGRL
ncbi:hypothetical protein SAMN05421837_101182 [Amycolatopsis pretoriensis]|uniref:DUF3558 domain-containing protein n=1 Tax=Amycolatopsis pretoriensis TaxID=218821 RepID=A0A1H5Q1Q4_9PSEU|nr:hypothetical protein [Amycolatopsis pretoriensis]SEF19986.1 hypothetical protein SAMN05421837_101182 [Amycolatopsis pretoriensis]